MGNNALKSCLVDQFYRFPGTAPPSQSQIAVSDQPSAIS